MASWTPVVRSFLEAHRVGHLATADPGAVPHVIPVCYALDDTSLYFVADAKPKRRPAHVLKRLENIAHNPRAALVVDDYDEDWSQLAWVLVRGPAGVLRDAQAHAAALVLLRRRYPQYRRMQIDDPERYPVVRIVPERITIWRAANGGR
jgi:PPOX class probable F420-dependent enzyme